MVYLREKRIQKSEADEFATLLVEDYYEIIKELATAILNNVPPSADQSTAIRLVREAVMTANAGIACEGI